MDRAVDWLFSRTTAELDALLGASTSTPAPPAGLDDGPGMYDLVGFISHLGQNTGSGHYVCHIKKDGRWTLFNDSKVRLNEHVKGASITLHSLNTIAQVAFSESPPFDMGFVYVFRRRV